LETLRLGENRLGPEGLSAFSSLKAIHELDLSGNGIANEGLETFGYLPALSTLKLAGNRIQAKGLRVIGRLAGIKVLDLSSNEFGAEGARAIANLRALSSLNLARNQIGGAGVEALSGLSSLTALGLADCLVGSKGANYLKRLQGLTTLDLSGNGIGSEGEKALSKLVKLQSLNLSANGIHDTTALEDLIDLRSLWLSHNGQVTASPRFWFRLGLERVYAYQVSLGQVPSELLSKSPTDDCLPRLRTYFDRSNVAHTDPDIELRDIKVMLLGNGRVGKTQLRRRLSGLPYEDTIPSTHGVEIVEATLTSSDGSSATPLKIWDFGGQEIYLGTHALFLKTRAVFPILWTPDMEANEVQEVGGQLFRNYPLEEWVRYVHALAGDRSPVLLVQAQCETADNARNPPVDVSLREAFTLPIRAVHYSARTSEGEASLLTALRAAVAWQGKERGVVRIPAAWGRIKAAIEAMQGTLAGRRITKDQFFSLCAEVGPEADRDRAEVLLDLLHQFGTLFHDADVFQDLIIIDQNWALQAIYSVFDRTPGGPYYTLRNRMFGRFTKGDLGRLVWDKDFSKVEQDAFIAMMHACAIAFPLRDAEGDDETLYIAPELLQSRDRIKGELAARWDSESEILSVSVAFEFLAPSFLREVMRTWGAIAGQAGLYWRDGLSFYDTETRARAILEVARPEAASWAGEIKIETQGGAAETLLARIADRAIEIAERYGGKAKDGPASSAEMLARRAVRLKSGEIAAETPDQPEIIPAAEPVLKERCFVSYAHGDDSQAGQLRSAAFAAVRKQLAILGYDPFYDIEQLSHGESVSGFIKLGALSPKFVVVLSRKYLRSPFCMDELRRIWRACGQERTTFQARVRAVCLQDAQIDNLMDREVVRDHWVAERKAWRQLKKKREDGGDRLGLEEYHQYDAAEHLAETVAAILLDIADTLYIRSLGDIVKLRFPD
jgi:internalin A